MIKSAMQGGDVMKWLISALMVAGVFMVDVVRADSFDLAYKSWGDFLTRFVENGQVDYAAVKNDPRLLNAAVGNLERLEAQDYKAWSREQKMAFWINAYNIAAVKVVTDHYPIERSFSWKALAYPSNSIQQIANVWDRSIVEIMGRQRSLDGMEKGILIKEFDDPRIHFALVCASRGCPVLRAQPYTAAKLDEQLEDQTRRFLSDPQKVRYDRRRDRLLLSPIFKWYGEEFRRAEGSVAGFVKKHAPSAKMKNMQPAGVGIEFLDYDWSLNDRLSGDPRSGGSGVGR